MEPATSVHTSLKGTHVNRLARAAYLLVSGCLVLSAAVACAGKSNTSQKAPSTLHAVMSEEADDLSPFTPNEQGKSQILSVIGTPMLYVNDAGTSTSKILKSWTASDDAKSVTLVLKPGMTWSDGQPITSADMAMSLNAYLDSTISPNAGRVGAVVGADAVVSGKAKTASGLATPDKSTLQISLAKPDSSWLAKFALAGTYWPLLPSHTLASVPLADLPKNDFFKNWPVSSGPYTLSKFTQGQFVEVDRNAKSPVGTPGFEHVVFAPLSTDQMTAQLQTGEVQYIYTVDPSDVDRVSKIPGVTVASHQGVAPDVFGLNNAAPQLQDPRIRQAMLYAIDRVSICKTILAGHCTTPLTNLRQIGPSWAIPTEGVTTYNYDPAKAKALLKQAGWNSKTKLTFLARTQRSYVDKAVTAAVGQMKAVGLDFQIRNITTAQLLDTIGKKSGWDAFWVSGADFVVDPDEWADYLLCSDRYPKGANTAQYCNPPVDKLLDQALTTVDQTQRGDLYKQAFTMVNQNPGEIYLYTVDSIIAYNSHLTGIKPSGNLSGGFWDIASWRWKV
jgi:peptide/nickel transport system substrate-binding protein